MFYKILEKYSQLKSEHKILQLEENNYIVEIEEQLLKKFMNLYDKDVKVIHSNQELIEKDPQILYKETEKITTATKIAVSLYDEFLENLKEAGDLYNWCSLLEAEMSEIHTSIASKHKGENIPIENLDLNDK